MKNGIIARGLKFAFLGFIIFEVLTYLTYREVFETPYRLKVHLILSIVFWTIGGLILSYLNFRKAEE